MSPLEELLRFITEGTIAGLPPIVVMAIPFILGLIVGYFIKKALKIAIIAALVIIVITYLGLFNLSFADLKNVIAQYGPQVAHYAVLLLGMLPFGLGFIIGIVIGFLLA